MARTEPIPFQIDLPQNLIDKPAWSWSTEEIHSCYGLDISTAGDAVPGGYNMSFIAYDPETGEKAGWLDLNTAGREGIIADIQVVPNFQRQKVASKLLDFARRYDPEMNIGHGMTTPEGDAWRRSLPPELQGPIPALAAK